MNVIRLSALRTVRLYPPGSIPGTHFCERLSRPQGHSAAGRIMSMKNSSDTIGNRTRNLPTLQCLNQLRYGVPHDCKVIRNIIQRNLPMTERQGVEFPHTNTHTHTHTYARYMQAVFPHRKVKFG